MGSRSSKLHTNVVHLVRLGAPWSAVVRPGVVWFVHPVQGVPGKKIGGRSTSGKDGQYRVIARLAPGLDRADRRSAYTAMDNEDGYEPLRILGARQLEARPCPVHGQVDSAATTARTLPALGLCSSPALWVRLEDLVQVLAHHPGVRAEGTEQLSGELIV